MRFKFRKITAVIAAIVLMVGIMPALNTVAVRADVECSHEDIYVDTTIYSSYPAHIKFMYCYDCSRYFLVSGTGEAVVYTPIPAEEDEELYGVLCYSPADYLDMYLRENYGIYVSPVACDDTCGHTSNCTKYYGVNEGDAVTELESYGSEGHLAVRRDKDGKFICIEANGTGYNLGIYDSDGGFSSTLSRLLAVEAPEGFEGTWIAPCIIPHTDEDSNGKCDDCGYRIGSTTCYHTAVTEDAVCDIPVESRTLNRYHFKGAVCPTCQELLAYDEKSQSFVALNADGDSSGAYVYSKVSGINCGLSECSQDVINNATGEAGADGLCDDCGGKYVAMNELVAVCPWNTSVTQPINRADGYGYYTVLRTGGTYDAQGHLKKATISDPEGNKYTALINYNSFWFFTGDADIFANFKYVSSQVLIPHTSQYACYNCDYMNVPSESQVTDIHYVQDLIGNGHKILGKYNGEDFIKLRYEQQCFVPVNGYADYWYENSYSYTYPCEYGEDGRCKHCGKEKIDISFSGYYVVDVSANGQSTSYTAHDDYYTLEGYMYKNSLSGLIKSLGCTGYVIKTVESSDENHLHASMADDLVYVVGGGSNLVLTVNKGLEDELQISFTASNMYNNSDGLKRVIEASSVMLPNDGQQYSLATLLAYSGIPHVDGCLKFTDITIGDPTVAQVVSNYYIKALKSGTTTISCNFSTSGCSYWGDTSGSATISLTTTDKIVTFYNEEGYVMSIKPVGEIYMPEYGTADGWTKGYTVSVDSVYRPKLVSSGTTYPVKTTVTFTEACDLWPVGIERSDLYFDASNVYGSVTYEDAISKGQRFVITETRDVSSLTLEDLAGFTFDKVWYSVYGAGNVQINNYSIAKLLQGTKSHYDEIYVCLMGEDGREVYEMEPDTAYIMDIYSELELNDGTYGELELYAKVLTGNQTEPEPVKDVPIYTPPVEPEDTKLEIVAQVDKEDTNVTISVKDDTLVVEEIQFNDTPAGSEAAEEPEKQSVLIDISKADKGVIGDIDSITITNNQVDALEEKASSLTIVFDDNHEVTMDEDMIEFLDEETGEKDDVVIVVRDIEENKLTEEQTEAVKESKHVIPFEAFMLINNREVHTFNGNKITAKLVVALPYRCQESELSVVHIAKNGTVEYIPALSTRIMWDGESYVAEFIVELNHFSEYAILISGEGAPEEEAAEDAEPAEPEDVTADEGDEADIKTAEEIKSEILASFDIRTQILDGLKFKAVEKNAEISWGAVDGAAYYKVFVAPCGKKYTPVETAETSVNLTKKLGYSASKYGYFKYYIAAYDANDNLIAKTPTIHVALDGAKKTNVTEINLVKYEYTVKVGKSKKIKIDGVELEDEDEEAVSHVREYRYISSNPAIAKVSKSGKVTGVSAGTAYIYVIANDGISAKAEITVK